MTLILSNYSQIKKNGNKSYLLSDVANIEFGPVSRKKPYLKATKLKIQNKI